MHTILQPADWLPPKGYSNGVIANGQQVIYVGGQIGWNGQCQFESEEFADQVRQALQNIVDILAEAEAGPEHITRLTWFITDKPAYTNNLKAIGQAYRDVMGRNFPPMSVIVVSALIEDEAKVEIEATAVK
jgi:enamine deaminase RidA (YjgF/YER057c/UK114 family)